MNSLSYHYYTIRNVNPLENFLKIIKYSNALIFVEKIEFRMKQIFL